MNATEGSVYDYYITPEEYEQAQANGIDRKTLNRRIRYAAWSKKRAMSTPKRIVERHPRSEKAAIAARNGIGYGTFISRVSRGMDEDQAATMPLVFGSGIPKMIEKNRIYPQEILDLAEQNGIPYETFQKRVRRCGWDYKKAATTPIISKQEQGRMGNEKLKEKYGEDYCRELYRWLFAPDRIRWGERQNGRT